MIKYTFILSPAGIGLDCHRTWEALCLGCIPIVCIPEFKNLFEKHVQGDFDNFYKEAGDDKKYSKFLALNLIDIVSSAPKRQRNIFLSSLINYAKSQSDISSVFIKAY